MVKYTVAVCNYNMAETVEKSLRSILDQLDERFEVLVIDDGSTDGSIEIISNLVDEYSNLRLVLSNNRNIGEARHESVQRAAGKYVLPQLDADDLYEDIIIDFVNIYHQIEEQINHQFLLKGRSLNMAPTDLLKTIPYRSLGYGEDKDLWRRLFADNRIIWLNHESPCRSIGYERKLLERVKVTYEITYTHFRSGITFPSFVNYTLRERTVRSLTQLLMSPFAYRSAVMEGRFVAPKGYEQMGRLNEEISKAEGTLQEVRTRRGIDIDIEELSERGRQVFSGEEVSKGT